jgi:hypothetical protein
MVHIDGQAFRPELPTTGFGHLACRPTGSLNKSGGNAPSHVTSRWLQPFPGGRFRGEPLDVSQGGRCLARIQNADLSRRVEHCAVTVD